MSELGMSGPRCPTDCGNLGKDRALYCGSLVGLRWEPRLLASLHGGPKPRSLGDSLFWGCVDFSSHPSHIQGPGQQGRKRSWPQAIFSLGGRPGWERDCQGGWGSAMGGGGCSGGGHHFLRDRRGSGHAGSGLGLPCGVLSGSHSPPPTSGCITNILGETGKFFPALGPSSPLKWVSNPSPFPWHQKKEPMSVESLCKLQDAHRGPVK